MTPPIPNHPHPGKGQYRAAWTRCSHGHPNLVPDPRDPTGHLRYCPTCARARAQAAADAVNYAAALLSLRRCDYVAEYGTKGSTALQVISRIEQGLTAPRPPSTPPRAAPRTRTGG